MATILTTFRITGLPLHVTSEQALPALVNALVASGECTVDHSRKIWKLSVVPSCYSDQTSCALLEWKGENDGFLASLSKDSFGTYQVEVAEDDWSFDRHFLGFTQLYTPTPGAAVAAEYVLEIKLLLA